MPMPPGDPTAYGEAVTFADIAARARISEPTQRPGTINVMGFIAEMCEAMARLEYNTAVQLARSGMVLGTPMPVARMMITNSLSLLRRPIPEDAPRPGKDNPLIEPDQVL